MPSPSRRRDTRLCREFYRADLFRCASAGNTPVTSIPVGTSQLHRHHSGRDTSVSVIHTATNAVVATVLVGTKPVGVAITPDGTKVYVANLGSNTVSVIARPGNLVATTVMVGSGPDAIAVTPDGLHAYVATRKINARKPFPHPSFLAK